jgi:opacity protein-like surface antigen
MNMKKAALLGGLVSAITLSASSALADRSDSYEFTLQVPYTYAETIESSGGAQIETEADAGFGFSVGYNYSNNFNLHGNFTWNSTSYSATSIIDTPSPTTEAYGGVMDAFTASLTGDYYFGNGALQPFVSGSLGWSTINSNIAAGPVEGVCWWDPWWGYICDYYQPTYGTDSWTYGVGGGLRFDISDKLFLRGGYSERWIDLDNAGNTSIGTLTVEFGFMY